MFIVTAIAVTTAAGESQAQRGWRLSSNEVTVLALPTSVAVDPLDLEYEPGEPVEGRTAHLDEDGVADFLVRSSSRLCGASGNCAFALVDGATGRDLGRVGGSLLVISERRANGRRVLHTWGALSADSGAAATYEYDGRVYRRVAFEVLAGERRRDRIRGWAALPALPATPE